MQDLKISEIIKATGGALLKGAGSDIIKSVSTDSRNIGVDCLFIPLVAERDGHDFIPSAIENGVRAVLTHKDIEVEGDVSVIKVDDTLKALGDIARFYKEKYNILTVSITGSVGKTTTKDIVYSALNQGVCTMKTQKNFNNHIGVPLTVFEIEKEHKIAVIEMGMSHFGEIDYLSSIVNPDIAVITNIGMSHIENLGSQEGIFKSKMEITNRFKKGNTLIVNGDDKFLSKTKGMGEYDVIYYGKDNPDNDVYAKDIHDFGLYGTEFVAVVDNREYPVKVNIPGAHNVYNALAAICVAKACKIDIKTAIEGIKNTKLTENRLEVEETKGMTLIKDYYNAAPDSIRAALSLMPTAKKAKRLVAILGDVLEMGDHAKDAHYALGKSVVDNGIDMLITAGENAKYIADGAKDLGFENVHSFMTTDEACEFVKGALCEGDAVLIKASHGMHFEKIYNAIKQ